MNTRQEKKTYGEWAITPNHLVYKTVTRIPCADLQDIALLQKLLELTKERPQQEDDFSTQDLEDLELTLKDVEFGLEQACYSQEDINAATQPLWNKLEEKKPYVGPKTQIPETLSPEKPKPEKREPQQTPPTQITAPADTPEITITAEQAPTVLKPRIPLLASKFWAVTDDSRLLLADAEVKLTPRTQKMFIAAMEYYPKPVPPRKMFEIVAGADREYKKSTLQNTYNRLQKQLKALNPTFSKYIERDLTGFRFNPNLKKPKPDATDSSTTIIGKWAYDGRRDLIFFDNEVIDPQPRARDSIIKVITSFPKVIDLEEMEDRMLPTSRNIKTPSERFRFYNKDFERKHPGEKGPFWYSEPLRGFVLNVDPNDVDEETKKQMEIAEYGPISISKKLGRIWIGDMPVQRFKSRLLNTLDTMIRNIGKSIPMTEMAMAIYELEEEEVTDDDIVNTIQAITAAKSFLNDIQKGLGDEMITTKTITYYVINDVSIEADTKPSTDPARNHDLDI